MYLVSDTIWRQYVLLPRRLVADMFCSDTFWSNMFYSDTFCSNMFCSCRPIFRIEGKFRAPKNSVLPFPPPLTIFLPINSSFHPPPQSYLGGTKHRFKGDAGWKEAFRKGGGKSCFSLVGQKYFSLGGGQNSKKFRTLRERFCPTKPKSCARPIIVVKRYASVPDAPRFYGSGHNYFTSTPLDVTHPPCGAEVLPYPPKREFRTVVFRRNI